MKFVRQVVALLDRPPRPSRFHQALWAESVRKRELTTDEAMLEAYVMGWVKTPPP